MTFWWAVHCVAANSIISKESILRCKDRLYDAFREANFIKDMSQLFVAGPPIVKNAMNEKNVHEFMKAIVAFSGVTVVEILGGAYNSSAGRGARAAQLTHR